jgi:hypothetical protein
VTEKTAYETSPVRNYYHSIERDRASECKVEAIEN